MKFHFSKHNLRGKQKTLQRLFEILPGLVSWTILLGMSALAFWKPLLAAVIIIAFDLYWLLRLFYMNIFLALSYSRLAIEKKTDWMMRAEGIDRLYSYWKEICTDSEKVHNRSNTSLMLHKHQLQALEKSKDLPPKLDEIYNLVIIPVANEGQEIIEPGIVSTFNGRFPAKRIILVLAVEDRAPDEVKEAARAMQKRYHSRFFDLLISFHPSGLKGEAKVKGANASWAARAAAGYLKKKKIAFENVIVSCFDADTVISPDYFSCLAYHYMVTPGRLAASFQPIPVYNNNIWQASSFARVLDIGSSFFQLIESTNTEKLVTFSSHSMSFKALVDVDYWPLDMISDDSAIFWKSFIHFDGVYKVVPMYVTLSMDITQAENWYKTMSNVYKQKRRWAWGVENFPIVMRAFIRNPQIPFYTRLKLAFKLFEAHISWTTWPFLLSIVSWLPAIFAGREFSHSIFYYSAPRIAGTIFSLASLGLINCIILSMLLLPKKKVKYGFFKRIGHIFEWILVPPISIFFGAIPALDAQTRLMLGKYMEFWVTVKKRK